MDLGHWILTGYPFNAVYGITMINIGIGNIVTGLHRISPMHQNFIRQNRWTILANPLFCIFVFVFFV